MACTCSLLPHLNNPLTKGVILWFRSASCYHCLYLLCANRLATNAHLFKGLSNDGTQFFLVHKLNRAHLFCHSMYPPLVSRESGRCCVCHCRPLFHCHSRCLPCTVRTFTSQYTLICKG